jgi:hypothetical protein
MATISAPPGTRFTSFRWAGMARRRYCGYALQLYAEAPASTSIAIKNVRANQRCPRPRRAQAAGYRSRTFDVSGATRIVQRVICVAATAGSRARRAAPTTCVRMRPKSVSPTCSRRQPRSSVTRRWPAANGCATSSHSTTCHRESRRCLRPVRRRRGPAEARRRRAARARRRRRRRDQTGCPRSGAAPAAPPPGRSRAGRAAR